eukprot:gene5422-6100_t
MSALLEKSIENKDEKFVIKTLKKMADYEYKLSAAKRQLIFEAFESDERIKEKVEALTMKNLDQH